MTEDEKAMKAGSQQAKKVILPFEFQTRDGEQMTIEEAVFQALGFASVCWTHTPAGVFESDRAKEAGDKLMELISESLDQPNLGLATTGQMLDELRARGEVAGIEELEQGALALLSTLPMDQLKYRTVDA